MKVGLWFLSAAAIAAVGTVLAASLPVPPSLSRTVTRPAPSAPAEPTTPPAPPPQAAVTPPAVPPAPAVERAKRVTAAAIADPSHPAKRPTRHVVKAAADRHHRAVAHATAPRYGAVVPKPPAAHPATPAREPTHIAMGPPPPYRMPPPYWRMAYPPDYY